MRYFLQKTLIFFEMIKIEHSIFALPFAYLGLFLGERGWPSASLFWGVTLAMVSFRTMGMGLNRIIDSAIDAKNPRTLNRALPAKKINLGFAWGATLLSFLVFEIAAFQLSKLCFYLSIIPVFLAILYPFTKRFTWFSHGVLGMILGIAPYGAWIASRGEFSWTPGLISLGVVTWVSGFDIIYALQDMNFDRASGLFSIPARFGSARALNLTRCLHVLTVLFWGGAGVVAGLGWFYGVGLLIVIGFLLREHWLIRSFGLEKVQEAFFIMNAFVSMSIFVAAFADVFWGGKYSG